MCTIDPDILYIKIFKKKIFFYKSTKKYLQKKRKTDISNTLIVEKQKQKVRQP